MIPLYTPVRVPNSPGLVGIVTAILGLSARVVLIRPDGTVARVSVYPIGLLDELPGPGTMV